MSNNTPLALRLRPEKLADFIGQSAVIGPDSWLRQAIKADNLPSLVFWGPPGSGKTTLALIIAKETKADFIELSATSSGVQDLKKIVEIAKATKRLGGKTLLFIDEIHRWNKAQQDALLPQVENGTLILIGATTENPSFALNSALMSRLKLIVLEPLSMSELEKIIKQAIKKLSLKIASPVIKLIARLANGDARRALGLLEAASQQSTDITADLVKKIANRPQLLYDKKGDEHFNLISALHKSMRGSQADAALYYLARILEGGEDPLYVARRLIIFASEDIGLANNSALLLATACYNACAKIGLPECSLNLAHTVVYLAKSPKNIDVYLAYGKVKQEVLKSGNLAVPLHLRNAPTKLMADLGYARDYKYTPLVDDSQQEYLPAALKGKRFFVPTKNKKNNSPDK